MEVRSNRVIAFRSVKTATFKSRITVEPLGFLVTTAFFIQVITNENLMMTKLCRVNNNSTTNSCDTNWDIQVNRSNITPPWTKEVHKYANTLNVYASMINNIPAVFVILLIGSWNDRNGKKPVIVIPIIGFLLSSLISVLNNLMQLWKAEYILLANIPVGLFGGLNTLTMILNGYLVDITAKESRTLRLAIMAAILTSTSPIAYFLAIYLYKYTNYLSVFLIALGILTLAFIYAFHFVTNSKGPNYEARVGPLIERITNNTEVIIVEYTMPKYELKNRARSSFCVLFFKKLFKCFSITFRARMGHQRSCVCILLIILCLTLFSTNVMTVYHEIRFEYTKKIFAWNALEFSIYLASETAIAVLGTLIILPLMINYTRISDPVIGIFSQIGQICAYLTVAFAVSPRMMYLSSLGMLLAPCTRVVIISQLSKIVGKEDTIYAYSVVACLESIVPLIASPILNFFHTSFFKSLIGASFLLEVFMKLIATILFFFFYFLQFKDSQVLTLLFLVRPAQHSPIN